MFINSLNSFERGFGLAQIDNRKFIAPLVAAAVPAIISAAGAVAGSVMNKKSIDSNNALQQKLVQDANVYNTPGMQMQRFQDAGLNPYMILGQVNAGNQTSVASTSPTDYSSGVQGVGNAANTLIQAQSALSQIDVNKAIVEKTQSETNINNTNLKFLEAKNEAEINNLVKQGKLTENQAKLIQQDVDLNSATWSDKLEAVGLQNGFTKESIEKMKAEIAKMLVETTGIDLQNRVFSKYGDAQAAATLSNTYSQTGVNRANVGLMGSQVGLNGMISGLYGKQISRYDELTDSQIINNKKSTFEQGIVRLVENIWKKFSDAGKHEPYYKKFQNRWTGKTEYLRVR